MYPLLFIEFVFSYITFCHCEERSDDEAISQLVRGLLRGVYTDWRSRVEVLAKTLIFSPNHQHFITDLEQLEESLHSW